jgi:hypothetical protein
MLRHKAYNLDMVQCLVFLSQECPEDGFDPAYYWLQSTDKAWYMAAPFSSFDLDLAMIHLPSIVLVTFSRLKPAMNRGIDRWALRLGTAEIFQADLGSEWIPADHPQVTFSEPVREGEDSSHVQSQARNRPC